MRFFSTDHRIPMLVYLVIALMLTIGVLGYYLYSSKKDVANAGALLASLNELSQYKINELTQKLDAAMQSNSDLQTLLQAKQSDVATYNAQVQELVGTVNQLDKLSKTDRELLEKYSSVYFLSENYVPATLSNIDPKYLFIPTKPQQIHSQVLPRLTALIDAARTAGIDLSVLSGYRSFGTQEQLKSEYKVVFGSGTANSFSADQGYSEHQLGSTVDFTTKKIGTVLDGFDKTPAFDWLQAHAYEYGFNMSYPKGNTHFVYEPWHWRYVGIDLAKRLHDEGKTLYDLDQREINLYLVKIFD